MSTALVLAEVHAGAIALSSDAEETRDALILAAGAIQRVSNQTELDRAVEMGVRMRKEIKVAEAARLELTRPIDAIKSRILNCARDEYIQPITGEMNRIGRLVSGFRIAEDARVREEERRRQEEIQARIAEQQAAEAAKAQAEKAFAETATGLQEVVAAEQAVERITDAFREVVLAPKPEAAKAKGAATRMVVKWRITDEAALFKACPHFFELTPRKRVINDCVTAKSEFPGLEVWEEPDTSFRSGGRQ